jgi:hypothetical protein
LITFRAPRIALGRRWEIVPIACTGSEVKGVPSKALRQISWYLFIFPISKFRLLWWALSYQNLQILAAQVAYSRDTVYPRYAPNQPSWEQLISWALEELTTTTTTTTPDTDTIAPLTQATVSVSVGEKLVNRDEEARQ